MVCYRTEGLQYIDSSLHPKPLPPIHTNPHLLEHPRRESCAVIDPLLSIAVAQLGIAHFSLTYSLYNLGVTLAAPHRLAKTYKIY